MWYYGNMIDFPIAELLDDSICLIWLERHLHPHGLTCPHCERSERRVFRAQGHFPAYRCRACNGYTLRRRIQANLNDTAPTAVMHDTAFEADELYQNAGEKKHLDVVWRPAVTILPL
jgi:hypothetical protein